MARIKLCWVVGNNKSAMKHATSLHKHAQTVVMEHTPYKNKLFVAYAVKAAFDRDETVPPVILTAVHQAVEEYTQQQTHALRGGAPLALAAPAPPEPVATAVAAPATAPTPTRMATMDEAWKQRLAEAIELVVEQEQHEEEALEGGGSESEHDEEPMSPDVAATKRQPFSEAEVRALRAGVKIHGKKNWTQILHDKRLTFAPHRTASGLQSKWRSLSRRQKKVS